MPKTWEVRNMDEEVCAAAYQAAKRAKVTTATWLATAIREKLERERDPIPGEIIGPDTAADTSGQSVLTGHSVPTDPLLVLAQAAYWLRGREGSRTPMVAAARKAVLARLKQLPLLNEQLGHERV